MALRWMCEIRQKEAVEYVTYLRPDIGLHIGRWKDEVGRMSGHRWAKLAWNANIQDESKLIPRN